MNYINDSGIAYLPLIQLGYLGPKLTVSKLQDSDDLSKSFLSLDPNQPLPLPSSTGFGCTSSTLVTAKWVSDYVSQAKLSKDISISILMTKAEEGTFLGNGLTTQTLTTTMIGQTYAATCADLTMLVNCAKLDTIDGGDPVFAKRSNL